MPHESYYSDKVLTIWPCDHSGVRVENGDVSLGYVCGECGARPARYLRADALTDDSVVHAAQEALRRQVGYGEFADRDETAAADRDLLRYVLNGVRGFVNANGPARAVAK